MDTINKNGVCGIIAEYNPFHNGHKFQTDLIKKSYDTVVSVMSGSFTQRGDIAVIDKWSRAESALRCGVDLVFELPAVFALSTADRFAYGGVSLMDSLGCVDALSFGSECGDINILKSAADSLINETPSQSTQIRKLLKQGFSYASAREQVFNNTISPGILNSSNNILATEYIKHLTLINSNIEPITHARIGSDYNSESLNSPTASAAAIRANLSSTKIAQQMPKEAFDVFYKAKKHTLSELDRAAVYFIRKNGAKSLIDALECTEGIENRIFEAARRFTSIEEIVSACSSKRYTKAKIRRIILCSMLGLNKDLCFQPPQYARVLGATEKGRVLLSRIKKNTNLKIVTKVADYKETNPMFERDILTTDIYFLDSCAGRDYTTSPVML